MSNLLPLTSRFEAGPREASRFDAGGTPETIGVRNKVSLTGLRDHRPVVTP